MSSVHTTALTLRLFVPYQPASEAALLRKVIVTALQRHGVQSLSNTQDQLLDLFLKRIINVSPELVWTA